MRPSPLHREAGRGSSRAGLWASTGWPAWPWSRHTFSQKMAQAEAYAWASCRLCRPLTGQGWGTPQAWWTLSTAVLAGVPAGMQAPGEPAGGREAPRHRCSCASEVGFHGPPQPQPHTPRAGGQPGSYLPDVQAYSLVVLAREAHGAPHSTVIPRRGLGPACPAQCVHPGSLQDGNVYLAGLQDPQPELGVAGKATVVPAAACRLSLDPGPGQLLRVAQHLLWGSNTSMSPLGMAPLPPPPSPALASSRAPRGRVGLGKAGTRASSRGAGPCAALPPQKVAAPDRGPAQAG